MFRVVEAFSGIGAQAQALKNIGIDYEIVSTIEWDVSAIYAYDIIHNGPQNLDAYKRVSKDIILKELSKYTLSRDGKTPLTKRGLQSMSEDMLRRIYCAIKRTHDLVNIADVNANDLPDNVDLLTYSFPCQDLSICGFWHQNTSGIDRDAHNRSGMLWEVERILKDYVEKEKKLPTFLLMENVSNILSEKHKKNFNEWKCYLNKIGYVNCVYTLNALNFGIPQNRNRTFMISVNCNNDSTQRKKIEAYFKANNLQENQTSNNIVRKNLRDFLRLEYSVKKYKVEADISNPNNTISRQKIYEDNQLIFDGEKMCCKTIKTITTKQDRNPNSGIIAYSSSNPKKAKYRNLTPRECFLLMGFNEDDFQMLIDNNFKTHGKSFFGREKLIKLAGNSIVVNVLEAIFKQIYDINEKIIKSK